MGMTTAALNTEQTVLAVAPDPVAEAASVPSLLTGASPAFDNNRWTPSEYEKRQYALAEAKAILDGEQALDKVGNVIKAAERIKDWLDGGSAS